MDSPNNSSANRQRRSWARRYIRPGFFITASMIGFVIFLSDNSLMGTYQHECEIDRLKAEIKENNDTLQYYKALNRSLETNPETMERIVRENYHMQRPNEDVYLFD